MYIVCSMSPIKADYSGMYGQAGSAKFVFYISDNMPKEIACDNYRQVFKLG